MSAGYRSRWLSFFIMFLMLSGPLSAITESSPFAQHELENDGVDAMLAAGGDPATQVYLNGDGTFTNEFTLDVPSTEPVTNVHLSMSPGIAPSSTGFSWSGPSAWGHSDAVSDGTTLDADGFLTGSRAGTLWDFNNGLQGWTVSSSTYVSRYTSNACGYNGTQGGSIKTQAPGASSAEHATSPSLNLGGSNSIPVHVWVQQGSSSCGEEPDTNEDLQLRYKTAAGSWVTLHTWLGSTFNTPAQQWTGTLPAAALHASTQLRMVQTGGTGSAFDYWFFDDVRIASPPVSNWTSPSVGWSSSSTFQVEQTTYAPVYIDAHVPFGASINWSVLDSNGVLVPGFTGSNTFTIPLHLLDESMYDSVRIRLSLSAGSGDELPLVYSLHGDGAKSTLYSEQQSLNDATVLCGPNDLFVPYGSVTSTAVLDSGWAYQASSSVSTTSSQGSGLTVQTNPAPYILNEVDRISNVTSPGSLYTASNGRSTTGGNGSGATVNTAATSITSGIISSSSLTATGSGYTSQIVSPAGGSGSGLQIQTTASPITGNGVVAQYSGLNGGTGYTSSNNVTVSGGNGSGLTVDYLATPIVTGIPTSYSLLNGGTNYSVTSFALTSGGSGSGLRVSVDAVSNGSITGITIISGGSGYGFFDKLFISGGDQDAYFYTTGISESGGTITSITLQNSGLNYTVGDTVSIAGGDGNANFTVSDTNRQGGSLTGYSILNNGSGYGINTLITIPGGDSNSRLRIDSVYSIGGNLTSVSLSSRGSGYSAGDVLTVNGGINGTFTVDAVRNWGGEIIAPIVQNGGQLYSLGDEVVLDGGAQNASLEVTSIDIDGYIGGSSCSLTGEQVHLVAPATRVTGSVSGTNVQLQMWDAFNSTWQTLSNSVSFDYTSATPIYDLQFRLVPLNATLGSWTIESFDYLIHYGEVSSNPRIDVNDDGEYEWGADFTGIGTWGWQDVFSNGNKSITAAVGSSGYATTKVLIPLSELHSFSFGALTADASITAYTLLYQSQILASESFEETSLLSVALNQSTRDFIEQSIAGQGGLNHLGTPFVEVDLEIYASSSVSMNGLLVTYSAQASQEFQSDSSLVLNLNDGRRLLPLIGGMHEIPLPLSSTQKGGLIVELLGLSSSSTVVLNSATIDPEVDTLTPSQRWRTISMSYSVIGVAPSMVRLDIHDDAYHATWSVPVSGATPFGTGDYERIELHPTDWMTVNQSGSSVLVEVQFRILPLWDDADSMQITTRLQLSNSVFSMPSTFTYGNFGSQAYENDLTLNRVTFSNEDEGAVLGSSDYYLLPYTKLNISAFVGFENVSTIDAFMDGEGMLSLYRGEVLVANTTTLDVNSWTYVDTVPFTYGPLTWRIELSSINGSVHPDFDMIERTFHIDTISPRVLEFNMDRYDHRMPSSTQTVHIQISDQPILPTNIQAMVWREWFDDDNSNQWPDEGEYQPFPLFIPNDLSPLIGQYTFMIDDTAGSLGQKVAVYLTGADDAGHPLEFGGSDSTDEHLFMYQLAIDGAPNVAPNAFSYTDGKHPWLHPQMPYSIDVHMTEPNGGSDLSTVVVELASNQGSDTLPIRWEFETGNCTTTSPHIIIKDCEMLGSDGPADPYEIDMTLHVDFSLAWTTPDLGETRREPGIRVIDRAGQEEFRVFPEHRWRFSAALEVPEESVSIILSQGALLGDGARMAPDSPFEIAGGVVFSETGTIPDFACAVDVLFAGSSVSANSLEGIWSVALQAPSTTQTLPLTWSVGCLEGQGVDATNQENAVRWIIVDGTGPEPVEVANPRPFSVLEPEAHEVKILLSEAGGLEVESLELVWWVEEKATGDRLRDGIEPLSLVGSDITGLRLEVIGSFNLSEITDEMLENRLSVHIYVSGRDLAGNEVLGLGGTAPGSPVAVWDMIWLKPEFELQSNSITYSRYLIEIGQTSIVTAYVENTGTLDGSIDVIFTEVRADGNRSNLRRINVEVPQGGIVPVATDWNPTETGLQWVEVQFEGELSSIGPSIDVRPQRDVSFSERVFGDVHPLLGSFAALLFVAIIATGLLWARRMTLNRGSKAEYDWDEYSSELEDEYDDEDDDEDETTSMTETAVAAVAAQDTPSSSTEQTDWVMGSDGYWWYHDKDANEWWYKNAEGEIVQHK
ncbi:MAG: hypothetical protein L7U62_05310 [Candidatus Poseidoniaceae archaeon]|nr:hypothetical protein [Candidatus Poseidoniaceae archaeon]